MKNQIKWRKKDKELLKKKVKNHNTKINRLLKKGCDEALLPNKIKYKELMDKITTRKDYNFEIKLIDTFTKRNSEKIDNVKKSKRGAILPSYLEKQIKLKLNRINRISKQRQPYENLPATDGNILIGGAAKENEGITNTSKKERLIISEVNSNNQLLELSRDIFYNERLKACREINKKFGLEIKVIKKGCRGQ